MLNNILINVGWIVALSLFVLLGSTIGSLLLERVRVRIDRWLDRQLVQLVLGWIVMGFVIYVLGLVQLLSSAAVIGISLVVLVGSWWVRPWQGLTQAGFRDLWRSLRLIDWLLLFAGVLFAGVLLIGALAPDIGFDSTWYHLPEAQQYLREHTTIIRYPAMLGESSVAPRLVDMLYTWAIAPWLSQPTLAQLIHWLSGVGLGLAAFAIARRSQLTTTGSLLAALLVYSSKPTLWLSKIAYVDLTVGFFGAVFVVCLLAWAASGQTRSVGWKVIAGVILGGFLAAKMQSLVFWPLALIGVWLVRHRLLDVVWVLLISLALTVPWYIEIWAVTGTPLFTFRRPPGDEHLGGGSSFGDWIFRIHPRTFLVDIVNTLRDQAAVLLPSLGILVFWRSLPALVRLLVSSGLVALIAWSYVPVHEIRYGLVILPLLAVGIGWLYDKASRGVRTTLLVCSCLVVVLNFCLMISIGRGSFRVGLGAEDRHDYLSRNLAGHLWIYYDHDRQVAPLIDSGRALTLIHNPMYVDFPALDGIRLKGSRYPNELSFAAIRSIWRTEGITHLAIRGPFGLKDFLPVDSAHQSNQEALAELTAQTEVLYADGMQTTVWRLR